MTKETQLAAPFNGRIPTREETRAMLAQHGIDLTTRILYEILCQANAEFIRQINAIKTQPSPGAASFKLLIVPALLYKEHPEFGGDGKAMTMAGGRWTDDDERTTMGGMR